jgi:hypothetical protein
VVSLVNGCLVRKDRLELSGLCRLMLTLWRSLKDIHCWKLQTERIENATIISCGTTNKGDYRAKVDCWCKQTRMVNVIVWCSCGRTVL